MNILITIATMIILVLTFLPLWRNPHWIVRSMDFPRLQLGVAAVVLICAQLALIPASDLRLSLVSIMLLCIAWQAWWILPYTVVWPLEVKDATDTNKDAQLCILTANVLTKNRQADKLLQLVRRHQPDILVTVESDQWWEDQLNVLQDSMPYAIKCPMDNLYGMHVYSRLPILEKSVEFLVERDVPSIHATFQFLSDERVRFHFLHPAPPSPTENTESSERDAELVLVARRIAEKEQGPIIVAGDLNDVAWSTTTRLFRKLSGLLDPRIGRGMFNTFHADYPFLRWPLDHLFHSKHFTLRSISRLPHIGSDHFPLLTLLAYQPVRGADQEGLEANRADREMANAILNEK